MSNKGTKIESKYKQALLGSVDFTSTGSTCVSNSKQDVARVQISRPAPSFTLWRLQTRGIQLAPGCRAHGKQQAPATARAEGHRPRRSWAWLFRLVHYSWAGSFNKTVTISADFYFISKSNDFYFEVFGKSKHTCLLQHMLSPHHNFPCSEEAGFSYRNTLLEVPEQPEASTRGI